MRQCVRDVGAGLYRGFLDQLLVGTVRDAERDAHAQNVLGQGPVGQTGGDEFRIWHHDIDVVVGVDQGAPDVYGLDGPGEPIVEFDVVADAQRALEQDDQSRDEIVDDRLQAKTDTDREGARDERKVGEVEADRGQCDQQGHEDDRVMRQAADRIECSLPTDLLFIRNAANRDTDAARQRPADREDYQGLHHVAWGHRRLADRKHGQVGQLADTQPGCLGGLPDIAEPQPETARVIADGVVDRRHQQFEVRDRTVELTDVCERFLGRANALIEETSCRASQVATIDRLHGQHFVFGLALPVG